MHWEVRKEAPRISNKKFSKIFLDGEVLGTSLLECPEGLELRCECDSFSECCSCVPKEKVICGDDMLLACTGEIMTRRCCTCIEKCPVGYSTTFKMDCALDCVSGNGTSPCCRCSSNDEEDFYCKKGLTKEVLNCGIREYLECSDDDKCCQCVEEIISESLIDDDPEYNDPVDQEYQERNEEVVEENIFFSEEKVVIVEVNEEIKEDESNNNEKEKIEINQTEEYVEEPKKPSECPSSFSKNLKSCPSKNLLEIECIKNQPECCHCVPRKCPSGYIYHSSFDNCDESLGYKNECQFFDTPYDSICCRCNSISCPDSAFPDPDIESCKTGMVKKCDGNMSGGKSCCTCIQAECPSGDYSTSIRQCGIGYKKECKGFYDRKRCCRCVSKECESGYGTDVKECKIGYKTCSGYSGESSCCRCNTGLSEEEIGNEKIENFCPEGYVDIDLYHYKQQQQQQQSNNNNNNNSPSFCGIGEYTSCLTNIKEYKNLDDWEDYSSCCRCEKICPDGFSTEVLSGCVEDNCVGPKENFLTALKLPNSLKKVDSSFCCKCKEL